MWQQPTTNQLVGAVFSLTGPDEPSEVYAWTEKCFNVLNMKMLSQHEWYYGINENGFLGTWHSDIEKFEFDKSALENILLCSYFKKEEQYTTLRVKCSIIEKMK